MLRLRTLPRGPRLPDTWTPGPPAAPVSAPEFLPRTRRSRGLRCYVPINTQFPPCIYVQCISGRACLNQHGAMRSFANFSACGCVVRVYLGMRTRTRARCKSADGDNSEKERGRERERENGKRERERESLDALFQCESRLVGLERTRERRIIG